MTHDQKSIEGIDSAMMAVFRSEVKRHGLMIHDGLKALSSDSTAHERLQPMISAIQAISGGARIIDYEKAVLVANAMKRVLVAFEKKDLTLGETEISGLLHGLEILNHMSEVPEDEEPFWIDTHLKEVDDWLRQMEIPGSKAKATSAGDEIIEGVFEKKREKPDVSSSHEKESSTPAERDVEPPDSAMCELFRTETQNHVAVLNDGLLALKEDPESREPLEAMVRAAHSLKGAARILGLKDASEVAGAMENFLDDVQKSEAVVDPGGIDTLFRGVDMQNRVAEHVAEPLWFSDHESEIMAVVTAIREIGTGTLTETKPSESPAKTVSSIQPKTAPAPSETAQMQSDFVGDPAMLDLFQAEVENHVAVLNDGLLALEDNPSATDQLEALMRAAHSIKGGARIVGLDAAVKVAHAMEDCFVAAQKGVVLLGSEQIDILFRIVDILIQIAESLRKGETDWVARHGAEIDNLVTAITAIIHGESPEPVTPSESAPETPDLPTEEPAKESELSPAKIEEAQTAVAPAEKSASVPEKTGEMDRTIRVTAGKIERLMGQAGEVVVGAGWLPSFSQSLLELKRNHLELLTLLDGLHETVLGKGRDPQLRELVRRAREKTKACTLELAERLNQIDIFTGSTAALADRIYHEVISVRMRPFADGVTGFPRLVRDLARDLGKKVRLEINGKSTEVDRDILEKLDAPLNHLLRNAVDHGIESPKERVAAGKTETGLLRLDASHRSGMLMITVSDDGRGIDIENLRGKIVQKQMANQEMVDKMSEPELMDFLFLPGFSTARNVTEISGRGVGLDVVHNMVHEVGGVVRAVSKPGQGLTFHIELPLTLSVVRTFVVEIAEEPYAFPLARIDRCLELSREDLEIVEDRQYFRFDNSNIALLDIHDVLELEKPLENQEKLPVVVLSDRMNAYGLAVDKFLGEYDLVVRPLDPRLGKVPDISSVAVMLDGSPVMIFDVEDLVRSIDNLLSGRRLRKLNQAFEAIEAKRHKRILVVDDSFTVREMERKLLESKGYLVDTAVDGVDGWNAIRTDNYDMVISDVDMPRMNGIELVTHIKRHAQLKSIPVIIVSYKDKEEDRLKGLQAGANYYLTKSSFQDDSFIEAAENLIGEA